MKDIFITGVFDDTDQFQEAAEDFFFELQCKYNLEDCGMSGRFPSYHWYCDDEVCVNVYVK